MITSLLRLIMVLAWLALGAACSTPATPVPTAIPTAVPILIVQPTPAPLPTTAPTAAANPIGMANPASAYCLQQGGQLEIRKDSKGNETGYCIFPDRSECEEWAFQRGECRPGMKPTAASSTGATLIIQVEKSQNGKMVQVAKGKTVEVSLEGAPGSTGYTWNLTDGNEAVLKPQFDPARPLDVYTPGAAMPGAPGKYSFKFTALSAGTAMLKFVHKQPWVPSDPRAETFTVTVVVQ